MSFVKSQASTEEILSSVKLFDITEHDRVVLFIGQNDSNPFHIKAELCSLMKSLKCPVFILKVHKNRYINENKVNYMLRMICRQYTRCTYVDIDYRNSHNILNDLCNSISSVLDQNDYNLRFLASTDKAVYRTCAGQKLSLIMKDTKNFECHSSIGKNCIPTSNQSTQTESEIPIVHETTLNNDLFRNFEGKKNVS